MTIAAHWTHDCSGKQDFDGPIIVVSTRYWPRGDGGHPLRQEIKPSAHSSIVLRDREEDHDRALIEENFEAETEEEVKQQVETWANEQRDRIIRAVIAALC